MPDTHSAGFQPSASNRWLNCAGSERLSKGFAESPSENADEGTLAHSMAELMIRHLIGRLNDAAYNKSLRALEGEIRAFYASAGHVDGTAAEMESYIEPYAEFIAEMFAGAKKKDGSAAIETERKVDLGAYIPGGFGTSDVVIISENVLTIVDLKYGKGVPVRAEGNSQLRLYALGTLDEVDIVYDIEQVNMMICQPRLDSTTEEAMSSDELLAWGENTVKPAIIAAGKADAPTTAGTWCRFCPAKTLCRARAEFAMAPEKYGRKSPDLLTDEELGDILTRSSALSEWVSTATAYALQAVLDGKAIPGWKAVEGRAIRKFKDDLKAAEKAEAAGYDEALIYERHMITLSAMEKLMGKKQFAEVMDGLIDKPAGKPTLVPESDKRPAITKDDAQDAFKEED